jgi:hypothetical protein
MVNNYQDASDEDEGVFHVITSKARSQPRRARSTAKNAEKGNSEICSAFFAAFLSGLRG